MYFERKGQANKKWDTQKGWDIEIESRSCLNLASNGRNRLITSKHSVLYHNIKTKTNNKNNKWDRVGTAAQGAEREAKTKEIIDCNYGIGIIVFRLDCLP